ncbi:hypothetical protein GCM10009564_45910 [Streptomyces thermogriseus]|uniref:Uncharacterized protein n=1 Tax=Streptomyces thermogriseus TaxID=75292 RepID=A0ABN1T527_9ACTN
MEGREGREGRRRAGDGYRETGTGGPGGTRRTGPEAAREKPHKGKRRAARGHACARALRLIV